MPAVLPLPLAGSTLATASSPATHEKQVHGNPIRTPAADSQAAGASRAMLKVVGVAGPDPIEAKVEALLAKMSLADKVNQMVQTCWSGSETGPVADARNGSVESRVRNGLGSVLSVTRPEDVANLQRIALTESPHKIPLLLEFDTICGFRTIGPQPAAQAQSWDPEVPFRVCKTAGAEQKACGVTGTFAPMSDLTRNPIWGRGIECAGGEDPHLTSIMTVASVKGFHAEGVATCVKHLAGYGYTTDGRDYRAASVSRAEFEDQILAPFWAALAAGCDSIMPAFNSINGIPNHANKKLLARVRKLAPNVRVISDWTGIKELIQHGVAADLKRAAQLAANAGVDMDMVADAYADNLVKLVQEGKVAETVVTEAARRILTLKAKYGLFENPYPDLAKYDRIVQSPEHRRTMLWAAERSAVLLTNKTFAGYRSSTSEPLLTAAAKKIAVIGPIADDGLAMLGHWRGLGRAEETVTPLGALRQRFGDARVEFARGSRVLAPGSAEMEEQAMQAAGAADVVVAVVGETAHMSGEANARTDPSLPAPQLALLKKLPQDKPIIAVVVGGRSMTEMEWLKDAPNVIGVVHALELGNLAGEALTNLLHGTDELGRKVNFGGKLAAPILRRLGDVGVHHMRLATGRPADVPGADPRYTSGPAIYDDDGNLLAGHERHVHDDPLWFFGQGCSYSEFSQGAVEVPPKITARQLREHGIEVSTTVTNTSGVAGDQVVQVYVRDLVASQVQPEKTLVGFERVRLEPGETRRVTFHLGVDAFDFFSEAKGRNLLEPGEFALWVGSSSSDEDCKTATVEVLAKAEPKTPVSGRAHQVR